MVPIIEEEHALQVTHERRPRITVSVLCFNLVYYMFYLFYYLKIFFDEVNTSSCLGFLKEIVVDHYIDGEVMKAFL